MNMRESLKKNQLIYQVYALYKAKLEEKRANAELKFYRKQAQKQGINALENDMLTLALRERLKKRGIEPCPKKKGGLHIFLAYNLENWEVILQNVLSRFGEVTEFEFRNRGFECNSSDWLRQRDRMNREMFNSFFDSNSKKHIDVFVGYLSGHNTDPMTLRKIGETGAVIFNFCLDDKLKFRSVKIGGRWSGPAAIVREVDLNLTNAIDCRIKYAREGGLALFWPQAADPIMHKPYEEPFLYDVSFVGQRYGWRSHLISTLRKRGIDVSVFGKGWDSGELSDDNMIKLYSKSRINLGFAGVSRSNKLMCLKGRDFEVTMSGGFYLTQHHPELSLVYDVGREIVTYRDAGDCAGKIKYFLAHPEEAQDIRTRGRERALRDHTWEKRFESIFEMAGIIEPAISDNICVSSQK